MSCGYQAPWFGASYPDGGCIDGVLWDLDSYDDGLLTVCGDIPCPACNTTAFLEWARDDAESTVTASYNGIATCGAVIWERAIGIARHENREAADAYLATVEPFTAADWPDRQAVYEGRASEHDTFDRQWPWETAP